MIQEYKLAYDLIDKSKKILITTHANPDGDALGSVCAFMNFFNGLHKDAAAIVDDIPENYTFLPGIYQIIALNKTKIDINLDDFDLIITADFNELRRSAIPEWLEQAFLKNIPFINIDHHQFNVRFGKVNLVDERASSTSNIIYDFFRYNKIIFNKDIATCLLTGILTDTGNLSNSATTLNAINAVSDLLKNGARFHKINSNILYNKNLNIMKLWGRLLTRLRKNFKYNIAYTVIKKEDLKDFNLPEDAADGLSNYLSEINGVSAVIVFKETDDGLIRGSMRSISDHVDVSKLAKILGGGGHRKAAGFSVKGNLSEDLGRWEIH